MKGNEQEAIQNADYTLSETSGEKVLSVSDSVIVKFNSNSSFLMLYVRMLIKSVLPYTIYFIMKQASNIAFFNNIKFFN